MKKEKRKELRALRDAVENRQQLSAEIARRFFDTDLYQKARVLLLYYSVGSEVSTRQLCLRALADNKEVAFPVCVDGDGYMEFFFIKDENENYIPEEEGSDIYLYNYVKYNSFSEYNIEKIVSISAMISVKHMHNQIFSGIKGFLKKYAKKYCVLIKQVIWFEYNKEGVYHYEDTGRIDRWF